MVDLKLEVKWEPVFTHYQCHGRGWIIQSDALLNSSAGRTENHALQLRKWKWRKINIFFFMIKSSQSGLIFKMAIIKWRLQRRAKQSFASVKCFCIFDPIKISFPSRLKKLTSSFIKRCQLWIAVLVWFQLFYSILIINLDHLFKAVSVSFFYSLNVISRWRSFTHSC